jgi:hypothetical protein
MINAITPITIKAPTQTPALKISPIAWQLLNEKIKIVTKIDMILFIINNLNQVNDPSSV